MGSETLPVFAPTHPLALAVALGIALPALLLGGAPKVAAAAVDACALVPVPAIHTIVGKDVPMVRHSPPTENAGVTRSSCVFQGSGSAAFLTVSSFDSTAAAQQHLDGYAEEVRKAGGTVGTDQVGSDAASFITPIGGVGQMFVVHGNVLVGAAVTREKEGATKWQLDRSRDLASAATGAL